MRGLALILLVLAGQAQALSCMRPDVADSFNRANDIAEPVYILRGVLTFDAALMPKDVVNEVRNPDPVPATFEGLGLTHDGFTTRFAGDLVLQPRCAGPWCGSTVPGQEVIVFATDLGDQLVVEIGACGGTVFQDPTPEMDAVLAACLRGEPCR